MDLLIIPIALAIGGTLLYFGANGLPQTPLDRLPAAFKGTPFSMSAWIQKQKPVARRISARIGSPIGPNARDEELVELMNEMIAVREELTQIKGAMHGRPVRRRAATTRPIEVRSPRPAASRASARPVASSRSSGRKLRTMTSRG